MTVDVDPIAGPAAPDPAEPPTDADLVAAAGDTTDIDTDIDAVAVAADPTDATDAVAGPADAADADEEAPPVLATDDELDSAIEGLLLVVDTPIGEDALASVLDQPVARVAEALHRLAAGYTAGRRGIDLRRAGEGWRFYTRDEHAPYVERLLLDGQRSKLTRAALETLAVIAYRQPVTRSRVAAVRGVNVDGVIRTLLARGLIEEQGTDPDTGGIRYRTTELFLERLGLASLEDLPPIAPLLPEVDSIDDVR